MKNTVISDSKNSTLNEIKNDNLMKTSINKFDMKVNVKLKEIKNNLDESGFLNITNNELKSTSKIAPFKVNTKFTDALNETSITKEIIGDLNKSTLVYLKFILKKY